MIKTLEIPKDHSTQRSPAGIATGTVIERAFYTFVDGEHELLLSARKAGDRLVQAVRSAEVEFALVADEPLILLGVRFGEVIPWTVTSYCWHQTPRDRRVLPPESGRPDESRALLHIQLVESEGGRTRAERNVTLWLHFTRALHEAIREQSRVPFDPKACERVLSRLKRDYPSEEALANSARLRSIGSP